MTEEKVLHVFILMHAQSTEKMRMIFMLKRLIYFLPFTFLYRNFYSQIVLRVVVEEGGRKK